MWKLREVLDTQYELSIRSVLIMLGKYSFVITKFEEKFKYRRHFMPNFIIAEKSQLGANKNNLSISLLLVISLQTSQHGLFDTVYNYFTRQLISMSKIKTNRF